MARPGLDKHVKFKRLVRTLGLPRPYVRGLLETLWDGTYENGDPVIGDAAAVEAASEWPGEDGKFTPALLGAGGEGSAGFIEEIPGQPGRYQVHDLFDHCPDYVKKRRTREVERQTRGQQITNPADNGGQRPPSTADDGGTAESDWTAADNGAPPAPAPAPTIQKSARAFVRPSVDEVRAFAEANGLNVDAQAFVDHYESNGWKVGRNAMKDWQAALRSWARRGPEFTGINQNGHTRTLPTGPSKRFHG